MSKTFVSFLRTSSEYLTSFGHGSVFKMRCEKIPVYILLNIIRRKQKFWLFLIRTFKKNQCRIKSSEDMNIG